MAHAIPDQNPGRTLKPGAGALNQRRVLFLVLGGAAALALLLARRGAGAGPAADPAATDPASTFADNGGQAAQLGNDVTGALGDFSTTLGGLTGALEALAGQQADLAQAQADLPGQLAAIGATGTAAVVDNAAPSAPGGDVMLAASDTGAAAGRPAPATFVKRSPSTGRLTEYRVGQSGRPIPVRAAPQPRATRVDLNARPQRSVAHNPVGKRVGGRPLGSTFVKRSASTHKQTLYRVGQSGRPIPVRTVRTGSAAGKKRH
jgi:hypothetical protein